MYMASMSCINSVESLRIKKRKKTLFLVIKDYLLSNWELAVNIKSMVLQSSIGWLTFRILALVMNVSLQIIVG